MNKILLLTGVSALLFSANANALELNPYVGAKLRYVDISTDVSEDDFKLDVDDKVVGGSLAIGASYKISNGAVRAELEYNRNEDAEKKEGLWVTDDAGNVTGYIDKGQKLEIETQSLMFNAYYDIDTGTKLTPYVGAGIGYAKVKGTSYILGVKGVSADDYNFAWQAGFGAGYALTDSVTFDAGYRYADYGDFKEDGAKVDTSAHEVYVGLRYSF